MRVNARRARSRRTAWIWFGRVMVALVVIGGWQALTATDVVDKFFYGQPSGIWDSLVHLFTQGSAFGSIWDNLWMTVQEAFYGFILGTIAGVLVGILLGSNRYLAAVFGPYIKVVNSIPRIVLGSIFIVAFGLGRVPEGAPRLGARVLRRLLQRLPGRS